MSNSKTVETEVKLYVTDLTSIEQRLQALGAHLAAPRVYERNVRYEDAANSLTKNEKVLRLRMDSRARLTYKDPYNTTTTGIMSRTELEVTVSDFEMMDLILRKLGFYAAWTYDKYRTTYEMDDCEIVLDELGFGLFVEIEGEADAIEAMITKLGLTNVKRIPASYSVLFFRVKRQLGLTFDDLTFENFKGVTIPPTLIESL
ncbi:MAG: class IV adenylate cyclase [Anaerolineae bacterium]|nr:class IV adenylate cyclase [Anaerolineae bacterium]